MSADWVDYPGEEDGEGHTVAGTVKRLADVESAALGNRRDLFVYLPPSYGSGERRYPVLYMHDGQNLFDDALAFGDEWGVDHVLEDGAEAGLEAIVVGVANGGEARLDEYSPWADEAHGGGRGADYVRFLVDEVKPRIDADFRTRPERDATGIAGSSMGGLISLYAFFAAPETFGFVAALSPAFWFADRAVFPFVEAAPKVDGRIYLDVGTNEGRDTVADVRRMKELLRWKGYRTGRDLAFVVEMGGAHNERAWRRRLPAALPFLLRGVAAR